VVLFGRRFVMQEFGIIHWTNIEKIRSCPVYKTAHKNQQELLGKFYCGKKEEKKSPL
jgi:hypothetical protein